MSEMIALGTKLGRYEIRAKIGAGGIGEMYYALSYFNSVAPSQVFQ